MTEQAPSGVRPPTELRLAARPESVRRARSFLRELLLGAGRERWADAAELAVSEVVTNGVLHAHSELTLRVRLLDDVVEVEVADANPSLPIQRRAHEADATTGRGLELVRALTRACGVRPEPSGKVVWFTVGDEEPAVEPSEAELLEAWDPAGLWDRPLPMERVVLRQLPTALWLAAREHHQAVLRELVLYLAEHDRPGAAALDLRLADEARILIWSALVAELDRRGADVPAQVDLELSVPAGLGHAFGALQDALDAGERLAAAERLLVRPALPEIVAVRDWACEQVVAQLAGVPPAPWPGTDQAHFTEQTSDTVAEPHWDATLVTESDQGVVAADDANRILAISPPLARALGWDPAQVVGRRVVALVPPEQREAHVAGFSRHLTTGQSRLLGESVELSVLRRDGSQVRCSFRLERAPTGGSRPVYLAWISPLIG